ncbi:MAG: galactokinase family protein [Rectinemataceae bacterium]
MKDIVALHQAEYDAPPDCVAHAPAIVKLLGEHTEGSDGIVLAAAISCEMRIAVSMRKDTSLRFYAADFGERKRAASGSLKYKREDRWANHIKAVYEAFSSPGVASPIAVSSAVSSAGVSSAAVSSAGFEGRGVNITISGDIPLGLSLGASAAIGMATALAFKSILGLSLKNEELAEIVCKAEADFFEKPVPIYNYLAATAPGANTLSVIDMRNSKRRAVQFLDENWTLVLTDSRVPRSSVEGELRERYDQCRKCLSYLSPNGSRSMRDVKTVELDELMGLLPESVRRRCLHVVEEIARVAEAEEALAKRDDIAFGRIINKSHNSLRSLYEVSCPEIDWLVKRALEIDGVLCSRMTGKGFGGCTVSVMKTEAIVEYRKRLEDYERIFGFKAQVYETSINGGLRITGS